MVLQPKDSSWTETANEYFHSFFSQETGYKYSGLGGPYLPEVQGNKELREEDEFAYNSSR